MKTILVVFFLFFNVSLNWGHEVLNQTVYQYYADGNVTSGLEPLPTGFKLNGKDITLQSGAIHYFRVHPGYWRDRLRKLRATGLIAVETYVPWNLHEPEPDVYDFGDGDNDFSSFLDLVQFLKTAQEEDLLVLLRPGPYICAEWEFGGFPSWLLRYDGIQLRTSESQYVDRVTRYWNKLLPLVENLQFTKGGPIIAFQIENEFGSVGYVSGPDTEYLKILKSLMEKNGVKELLFTSDNDSGTSGSLPDVYKTINFQSNPVKHLDGLVKIQPDKPPMVMEFWTGWFDYWMLPASHNRFSPQEYGEILEQIITYPASFNLYMFHGGTSFGFMNGGNGATTSLQTFDVTSYDYGAPLSESGDYTEKYNITCELIAKHNKILFKNPVRPNESIKQVYSTILVESYLELEDLYQHVEVRQNTNDVVNSEMLNINHCSGQSYGYTMYKKTNVNVEAGSKLMISGHVHDIAQVLVDNKLQTKVLENVGDMLSFGYWTVPNNVLELKDNGSTLDILVENSGRINFGYFSYNQKKGLYDGPILLNDDPLHDWEITAFEFKSKWLERLTEDEQWKKYESSSVSNPSPRLFRATLKIEDKPQDTFVDMSNWKKGVVFVNNFNLGRYNFLGPQKTLYLPGPLLKQGDNTILIFENFLCPGSVVFTDKPVLSSHVPEVQNPNIDGLGVIFM